MHELSLASAVIDTAARHAGGCQVTQVHLRVGTLRQVVPGTLAFYFDHVAGGTACEGARLTQEVVPAALGCDGCGFAWEPVEVAFRCPRCQSAAVTVTAGDEFEVEWITIEQLEEPCIA